MPRINAHTVLLHDELDFIDNVASCSLDPENGSSLDNVICGRMFANNAWSVVKKGVAAHTVSVLTVSNHNLLQSVAFYQHFFVSFLPSVVILVLDVDDGTLDTMNSLQQE